MSAHLSAAGCTVSPVLGQVSGICSSKGSLNMAIDYTALVPFFVLGGGVLVLLALAALLPKRLPYGPIWAGIATLAGTGTIVDGLVQWHNTTGLTIGNQGNATGPLALGGQLFYDQLGAFFCVLFGSATVLGAWISHAYLTRENLDGPEPYILMLSCSTGAVLMAEAAGFITLFLGLEILSISLYTLTAYHRRRTASGEAGLKYFILGSFASAIFIYGVALIYGAVGSTLYYGAIDMLVTSQIIHNGVLLAGIGLVIVGLAFKVSAAPFHFWSPDVYQGAPTPFVGYMAAVAKAAGFAALLRVLLLAVNTQQADWRPIIWVLAVASVLVGSVLALVQADIKRLLAYSSISQAGYVLIALQAGSTYSLSAVCFYVFTYTFMVIGTFAIVGVVQGRGEARNDLSSLRGLASRQPWLAAAMLVLLLAQAGIPLTSGFLGKWVVISAAVQKGQYALALIGMLSAAIVAFAYLRLALIMYMSPEPNASQPAAAGASDAAYGGGDVSDLPEVVTAGLAARDSALALRPPPTARLRVPAPVSATVAVCVAFTIFAGVSTPVLSWAHSIALPW
ncbi:MAG TPA: NADH-quinone oxidoreductase subunit N [Acidimicrobiales bacterium]|nr:NADH-quinone oxidoreductase subunit N [Acidimicrobiales bacterium]